MQDLEAQNNRSEVLKLLNSMNDKIDKLEFASQSRYSVNTSFSCMGVATFIMVIIILTKLSHLKSLIHDIN